MYGKSNIARRVLLFLFAGSIFVSRIPAQGRHPSPLLQYIHKVYTSDDGLPQNRARAIVQTHDGFLWIGTQDGLARFNGTTFQVFDKQNTPELTHNDITSLFEAADSTLWIGTFNGLIKLKKGVFTAQPIDTGPVRGIDADRDGTLWIGTMNNGIFKSTNGRFDSITAAEGLRNNALNILSVDHQGRVWMAISGKGLDIYQDGTLLTYSTKNGFPSNSVQSFCMSSDNIVWIGTESGLVRWNGTSFRTYTTAHGLPDNVITALYEDKSGTLWVGTEGGGICRFKNNVFTSYGFKDGLSNNYVTAIVEDREGSLWVGKLQCGVESVLERKIYQLHLASWRACLHHTHNDDCP